MPPCTPSGSGRARWASGGWPKHCAAGPQIPTRRPAAKSPAPRPADRERDRQDQEQERAREPEDFGDSWRAYRERADHLHQAYGWTVPEPPPRAEPWLPLGRDTDQEHDQPPDRSRWHEDRDTDREDR